MIKFFIYLLLFYIASRLIFGKLLGGGKTKVFRFDTHHHHYNQGQKPEGSITVNEKTVKPKPNDKNLGEYVDYEEVK
ncbi:MAG: hypothetical protein V4658_05755 [Bacteroidota bacterium]